MEKGLKIIREIRLQIPEYDDSARADLDKVIKILTGEEKEEINISQFYYDFCIRHQIHGNEVVVQQF